MACDVSSPWDIYLEFVEGLKKHAVEIIWPEVQWSLRTVEQTKKKKLFLRFHLEPHAAAD
jgi:hypothetical protein